MFEKKLSLAFALGIFYIYFFNFERGFYGFFSMLFSEAPASSDKKKLKQFLLHCTSICMSSKNGFKNFKILFQTGDINIFVLGGIFFSRFVQLNSSFSEEKKSAVKSETLFSRKAIKV